MSSYAMPSKSSLVHGAAVTLALSAARRYYYNVPGYSAWCLLGGLVAMEVSAIQSRLPNFVSNLLSKLPIDVSSSLVALAGAVSLEMAVDGAIALSDFRSQASLERMLVGAAAAFAGLYAGDMVSGYLTSQ